VILRGLPKISGRGGDEALEGLGSEEVISPLARGPRSALSVEWAALAPAGAAGVVEGAPGAAGVLVVAGAAAAVPVVSGLPPRWGALSSGEPGRLPRQAVRPEMHDSPLLRRRAAASPVWR
jgi:hypothetical protein